MILLNIVANGGPYEIVNNLRTSIYRVKLLGK